MLGLGFLFGLGRRLLAGPVADSGLLPAGYYRHLTLAALEAEDFPEALHYLPWAEDPVLAQLLILRLRLLTVRHQQQRQALLYLLSQEPPEEQKEKYYTLLTQEDRALELLGQYEDQAWSFLRGGPGEISEQSQ